MKLSLQYPVVSPIVNRAFGVMPEFYAKYGLKGHNGIDFFALRGDRIFAAHPGIVTHTHMNVIEGIGIVIKTLEKFDFETGQAFFKTIYWHLLAVNVKVGQQVKAGDFIGWADNTGESTGDHLHFALKPVALGEKDFEWSNVKQSNGYFGAIDPQPYFVLSDAEIRKSLWMQLEAAKKTLQALLARVSPPKPSIDLWGLYPKPGRMKDALLARMKALGHPIIITEGYRSYERQAELYAQGRTKPGSIVTNARPGESFHQHRVAFDIAFLGPKGVTYEGPWDIVGAEGEKMGLEWGGRWKDPVDRPHFQYTGGYKLSHFQQGLINLADFS